MKVSNDVSHENLGNSSFAVLNGINVNAQVEKKGQFSYLSWPYAVAQLRLVDPTASWEVKRFDGLPYLATETGVYVEVAVTVQGVTLSQLHPVLDGKNRPLLAPSAFDINTSIQRCLVKAIALHGLGLYIYAGEDLPTATQGISEPEPTPKATKTGKMPTPIRPNVALINAAQQAQITTLLAETGAELERLLAYFHVQQLEQIKASDFPRVIRSLEHRRAA